MSRSALSNAAVICWSILCLVGSARADDRQGSVLSVGYADVEITPPLGTSMPGGFHDRMATGVLDPLMATVLLGRTRDKQHPAEIAVRLLNRLAQSDEATHTANSKP